MKEENIPVYKIAIIEDDEADYFVISDYIGDIREASFDITWCYNYQDGLNALLGGKYDLYFIDYRLGAKTGIDLLREAIRNGCESPIILLTGRGNYDIDRQAMEIGAYDYLIKSELNTEKLERCIRYSLGKAESIKALKANERKYRNVFEKSRDLIFICDYEGIIIDINYAASELLGEEESELPGRHLCDYFVNRKDCEIFLERLEKDGDLDEVEVQLKGAGGETKFCILSASIERNTDGSSYIQGVLHDITSRKKAEKSAIQVEKLAAAGRLVRTLAHEVRNPLNNIQVAAQQILPSVTGEDDKLYMDIISRNTQRISNLITHLLQSSVPSEIKTARESLQDILGEALQEAGDKATLNKVRVKTHLPANTAWAMLDRTKIRIALLNIIINAIEAMNEGGELSVSLMSDEDRHTIMISDTGMGITEENLARLFEPYFTSKRNGMGLGLAATLNFIQAHNGSVDAVSSPGEGTTFIITLANAENIAVGTVLTEKDG